MMADIKTALARAYRMAQVDGNRIGAVTELRAALGADAGLMAAAKGEHERLGRFMGSIRGQGRGACHVSKVTHGLLISALG